MDGFYVAIVDDDAAVREAVEGLLKSAGFNAQGFASAEDFLMSTRSCRAGCVVLDVRLPGMSGLELQQHLIGVGCRAPIVFITTQEDGRARMEEQALQAGALAFLRKPFGGEDLLRIVGLARNARR